MRAPVQTAFWRRGRGWGLGICALFLFATTQQPRIPLPRRITGVTPRVFMRHAPISFQLTPSRTSSLHRISITHAGPVTVEIRWEPASVALSATLNRGRRPRPVGGVQTVSAGPGLLLLAYKGPTTALRNWTVRVAFADPSRVATVTGRMIVNEGVLPGRKRPYTPGERLYLAVQKMKGENPFFVVFMHTLERFVRGIPDSEKSVLDRALERALEKRPGISRAMIQRLIRDYHALPETLRMKVTPEPLRDLTVDQKLDMDLLRRLIVIRSVPIPATWKMPMPQLHVLAPSAFATGLKAHDQMLKWLMYWANPPHIERLNKSSFEPGDIVDILGKNFTPEPENNRINILEEYYGEMAAVTQPEVERATKNAIRFHVPKDMPPGHYYLQIETRRAAGWRKSNLFGFHVRELPPPPPSIQKVLPIKGQYPGGRVLIRGSGIDTSGKWKQFVEIESLATGEIRDLWLKKGDVSSSEIRFTLPRDLIPGNYYVRVWQAGEPSQSSVYTARPYRYILTFTRIHCKDETDPEFWGSDEIVTVWGILADGKMWLKTSKVYEGFDDGDTKYYKSSDRVVFPISGKSKAVKAVLAVSVKLYEWDSGDAKAAEKYIGMAGDVADVITSGLGAAELGTLLNMVMDALGALVAWLGGDPDDLGRESLSWTVIKLQEQILPPPRPLIFKGKDYHYVVYASISRHP